MSWPILVEQFTGNQSTRVGCEKCGNERQGTTDDMVLDSWVHRCEWGCGGTMEFKYQVADKCFCGKLGHFSSATDFNCSRRCQLEAEYARELEAKKADSLASIGMGES